MASHSINALPIELLVFVIENLEDVRDIAALARVNRRSYTTANPLLYRQAVRINDARPLAWAARHGLVSTLNLALNAGIDPNHEFVELIPVDEWKKTCAAARAVSMLGRVDQEWDADPSANSPDDSSHHAGTPASSSTSTADQSQSGTADQVSIVSTPSDASSTDLAPTADMVTRRFQAMHLAASRGHDDIIALLLEHGASFNAAAERLCTCTKLQGLLNALENPEEEDPNYPTTWSPLHIAICHSHTSTAKLLLSRGAPHMMEYWTDPSDWLSGYINPSLTALHHAAAMGLTDLITYLVSNGIQKDVNLPDDRTFTPLYYAYAHRRWDSSVPLLLSLGADIDVETKLYIPYCAVTPLGEACRMGHFDAVDRLIDLGANVRHGFVASGGGMAPGGGCLTPLHMVCMRSARAVDAPKYDEGEQEEEWKAKARIRTIGKLIAKGARTDVRDCFGSTPLIAATKCGNVPAIEGLRRAGVVVSDDSATAPVGVVQQVKVSRGVAASGQ